MNPNRPCFLCVMGGLLSLAMLGCSTTPRLPKANAPVPDNWSKNVGVDNGRGVTFAEKPQAEAWWRQFHDPVLDALVERALAGCVDLKAAEARVREARAQRTVTISDFFPHTSLGGTEQRTRSSRAEMAAMGPVGLLQPSHRSLYQAGFDTSWEIDIFGGTRASARGADARIAAELSGYEGVRISVAAETARNYFELRGAQAMRDVLEEMVRSQQETVKLLQRRRAAGAIADLEVTMSQGTVETTSAQIPVAETNIQRMTTSLAVLLAENPDSVRERLGGQDAVPAHSVPIVVGVPAEVLRARPDVRRAEHGIEAAAAAVGVSTAELFPRVNLLGSGGVQGLEFSDLGNMVNRYWSIGPAVHWPILDIGRVLGNIRVQRARHEQALHAYEKTVLSALKDVEDAVVAYREAQTRQERLAKAVQQYGASLEMARSMYRAGTKDYLYVLESQRALLGAREAQVGGDTGVATAAVGLCKALGGCWPDPSAVAGEGQDGHNDHGEKVETETETETEKDKAKVSDAQPAKAGAALTTNEGK